MGTIRIENGSEFEQGVNDATRKLIGFYRCTLRELLDIGEQPKQPYADSSGSRSGPSRKRVSIPKLYGNEFDYTA